MKIYETGARLIILALIYVVFMYLNDTYVGTILLSITFVICCCIVLLEGWLRRKMERDG